MASDRVAVLTVRAARLGVIDFAQARIRDVRWWRRTNLLLTDLANDSNERLIDAAFRFHLALVTNSSLTDDSWKREKDSAAACYNDLVALQQPWAAQDSAKTKQAEQTELRNKYNKLIGNLDDPEFYNNVILKEVARMEADMAGTVNVETTDERIERLFKERILKQGDNHGR